MRSKEFIAEQTVERMQDDVVRALPTTYVIPELKNQDPYLQYRFGVAMAGAKGKKQREADGVPSYSKESVWGENQIVSSIDPDIGDWIDEALRELGMKGKKLISTPKSEEAKDTGIVSPIKAFKGYKK